MKKIISILLTALLLLSPLAYSEGLFDQSGLNFLKSEPELLPVDQAFAMDFKQVGNQVKISFVIADGYYLYRDKLKFSASNASIDKITLPEGKTHIDDYFGEQQVYYNFVTLPVSFTQAANDAVLNVTFMGCAEDKLCYPPTTREIPLSTIVPHPQTGTHAAIATSDTNAPQTAEKTLTDSQAIPLSQQDSLSKMLENSSLFWTLLSFFVLGIGLALTPCVFPMYPILSGIIVGQGKKLSTAKAFSLSMAYVQGMAITYSLLGLVVASAGMKYQAALQHPAVLVVLAILFIVLSLSMFGLYDLTLPSKWQNKMSNLSNNQKGGKLIGVFLMGAISGLVASPCTTAPLSGALIYIAQTGDLVLGFLALYILSIGMGIPLLIMGTSGGKLLPKAGQWMNVIKTIFGFLLIAVSITLIARIWAGTVADVLWAVWGITLVGYLMHQNKLTAFNWKQTVRSVLLILSLLALFSFGFQSVMQHFGFSAYTQINSQQEKGFIKVKSLADVETQVAKAASQGKPVMLDLYADWCVACKEFEHITFQDPDVKQRMGQMVLLQADVTKNDATDIALLEHYDVLGLPTLLMFNRQGERVSSLTVTGFMKPQPFAKHLDTVLSTQ
ncbi:protein-disulfide reductase DsbD [Shewanella surugensis]|uniref:Thiol:disulfide interchange protein DsbD n=1 Tax=Shewanella surugensis TaxID=212020 RepID=A0ABT0LBJ2_9GAMM|nr:protein-disulfide reductase DsbD [Shewanella surugensis]MCL1124551.1 protein-disulfide reductase DsbD [Shewanella surugensis]